VSLLVSLPLLLLFAALGFEGLNLRPHAYKTGVVTA
jgi:hypothetical protein